MVFVINNQSIIFIKYIIQFTIQLYTLLMSVLHCRVDMRGCVKKVK